MKKTKITITEKQAQQFNTMLAVLRKISADYMKPHEYTKNNYGLDASEALEMGYVNIQTEAKNAAKRVRYIEIKKPMYRRSMPKPCPGPIDNNAAACDWVAGPEYIETTSAEISQLDFDRKGK